MNGIHNVWINGRVLPEDRATISVFDRGFGYGDGLFETMKGYKGRVFALERHLQRLGRGLNEISIPFKAENLERIGAAIKELLKKNRLGEGEAYIRIIVTRGTDYTGGINPSKEISPTTCIIAREIDSKVIKRLQTDGIGIKPVDDCRPSRQHLKALGLLPSILSRITLQDEGFEEGVIVRDGLIKEGITSNIFIVKEGSLFTPPPDGSILPGITREIVMEMATKADLKCIEKDMGIDALLNADEAFITNSIIEIVPIIRIAERLLNNGRRGQFVSTIQKLYRGIVEGCDGFI